MSDVRDVNNAILGGFPSTGHSTSSANFSQLPCDRGVPNGPRGLHRFEMSPGAERAVCRHCGETGPRFSF